MHFFFFVTLLSFILKCSYLEMVRTIQGLLLSLVGVPGTARLRITLLLKQHLSMRCALSSVCDEVFLHW